MTKLDQWLAAQDQRARYAWIPACGGREVPFAYHGYVLMYMWNTETGEHAYYRQDHDIFYTDMSCSQILGGDQCASCNQ